MTARPHVILPAAPTHHIVDLPLTRLHYIKCGQGPPLIMVPATISDLNNWVPLTQFMGQSFTAYFFELPGHGKSTPFPQPFSSDLVAQTVEQLVDRLGIERFSVMGFSFGGVLAMKVLARLERRIERMILLSPAVITQALGYGWPRLVGLQFMMALFCRPQICDLFIRFIRNEFTGRLAERFLRRVGRIEDTIALRKRLLEIDAATFDVLAHQMVEVLHLKPAGRRERYPQTCYFAMSINDPVLDYSTTLSTVENQFVKTVWHTLDLPYHQPPTFPQFSDLTGLYGDLLKQLDDLEHNGKPPAGPERRLIETAPGGYSGIQATPR